MDTEDEPKHIPDTIRETMAIMQSELKLEDFEALRKSEKIDTFSLHMGYGMYVRNRFGLWAENSPLQSRFKGKGFGHPDDMSSFLMDAVIAALQGDEEMMDIFDKEPDDKAWRRRWQMMKYEKAKNEEGNSDS